MSTNEKDRVLQAIRQLGLRVTAADVAAKTGLPLALSTSQLNAIACQTGGNLQVATTGDIAYCFSPGFQNAYLARGIARLLQQAGAAVFKAAYYLLRISFGVMLIVSLVAIVVLIFIVMNTLQRAASSSDDDRGAAFEFNFFDYLILRDLLCWGTWSSLPGSYSYDEPYGRRKAKGNFLLDCFSFLFGDGNPNAHLEERRARAIAATIRLNKGVVTAEQLAPYTGVDPQRSYGILPVLVSFDGRPEVTESGNLVYIFPSMQVSASAGGSASEAGQESTDRVSQPGFKSGQHSFLYEFPWKFTSISGDSLVWVSILAGANFLGAWWLYSQLFSPLHAMLQPFAFLIRILVVYGTLFLLLPAGRFLVLQMLNKGIAARNAGRSHYAEQLGSSRQIQVKLKEAQAFKIEKQELSQDKVVYTTEKDSLEQEIEAGP